MCVFCNVWVCVCVGFVMCVCFVMCGCVYVWVCVGDFNVRVCLCVCFFVYASLHFPVQFITLHNQDVWIVHLIFSLSYLNLRNCYSNSCRILTLLVICISSAT